MPHMPASNMASMEPRRSLRRRSTAVNVPSVTSANGTLYSKVLPGTPLASRMDENPRAWTIEINGLIIDARFLRREYQEEAFRKGLIPYIPADRACDSKE